MAREPSERTKQGRRGESVDAAMNTVTCHASALGTTRQAGGDGWSGQESDFPR